MDSLYLILGSEGALADSALLKLTTQLKEESAELTTLFASEVIVGDIADALAPSLFSERRALVIKELQDLAEESRDEITRYLDNVDPTTTVIFMHKGGVKGKALLDAIKKAKATIIACEPLKKESEKSGDEIMAAMLELFIAEPSPGLVANCCVVVSGHRTLISILENLLCIPRVTT